MSRIECKYESDVLDAVASGRWPDRADSELRNHAATCNICADVALISVLYRDDHASVMEQARVPSAGLVWWKSELRARREAVRVASRPITLVQWIASGCIVAALLGILMGLSTRIDLGTVSTFVLEQPLVLWLALGLIVALTPIVLYFVYSDE